LTGANEITLELATVYDPCDSDAYYNAPLASASTLCKLQVAGSGNATLCIALNDVRGGIVIEGGVDPCSTDINNSGACFEVALAPAYCVGDATGDSEVQFGDLGTIAGWLNNFGTTVSKVRRIYSSSPAYNPAGDATGDDEIQFGDLGTIAGWLNNFGTTVSKVRRIYCPHPY
jgi:hypothetical protein